MELLSKLGVEPLVLLAQLVNVGILFGLLSYFFYRPLLDLLDRRRQTIAEGLENARVYKEKKAWLEHERARQLADAETESRRMKEAATETAERLLAEARSRAKEERMALLLDARRRIEGERAAALSGLEQDITDLTIRAAGRLLEDAWEPKLEEQYITALLKKETAEVLKAEG